MIYIFCNLIIAFLLPSMIVYKYEGDRIKKLPILPYLLTNLVLLAFGLFLFPLWLILCIVPGTCLYGSELYLFIFYIVYTTD